MLHGIWNGGKIEDCGPTTTMLLGGGNMVDLDSNRGVDGELLPTEIKAWGFQIESILSKYNHI